VSAVATAHPIKLKKSLKTFLSGFSCPGDGGVRVASLRARLPNRLVLTFWWGN